jgi:hypothetical protein
MKFKLDENFGTRTQQPPRNPSLALLESLIRQFLQALTQMSVEKLLWIVEVGRIRVHQLEGDKQSGFEEKTDNSD